MFVDTKIDDLTLLKGLGSFWNQIFTEKLTLRGYTRGLSEELIQEYYLFLETLNSYSVKDIPAFNRTKWAPIFIRKSEFNKVPLFFEADDAVFGPQPMASLFNGKIFQFGFPKSATDSFVVRIDAKINSFSAITDQIINPKHFFFKGINIFRKGDELFFNSNIFELPDVTKTKIIGDDGLIVTFTDANGAVVDDELITFWIYNVDFDLNNLENHFSHLFEFKIADRVKYKEILKALFAIGVLGPTVNAFKTLIAAFSGIELVKTDGEVVESVLETVENKFVVTDKHVYRFDLTHNVLATVIAGAVLRKGDILVDLFAYYDSQENPRWWNVVFSEERKVGMSPYVFVGNFKHQLTFSNKLELITLSKDDVLRFPVEGDPRDVEEFQKWINQPTNKAFVKEKLGLVLSSDPNVNRQAYPLIPVDFLFSNFFKNNCAFFIYKLRANSDFITFFNYFSVIKEYLPAHVYVLIDINLSVDVETMPPLNLSFQYAPSILLNSDGSDKTGNIDDVGSLADYSKYDLTRRLFSMSRTVGKDPDNLPLFTDQNMQELNCNSNSAPCIRDGKIFTHIPNNATTRDVKTIQLIDFSE